MNSAGRGRAGSPGTHPERRVEDGDTGWTGGWNRCEDEARRPARAIQGVDRVAASHLGSAERCPRGHVGDIDWHSFVHGAGTDCHRELWVEERTTSGDLDAIWIRCSCGVDRPMSQAARMNLDALGHCKGDRPWLGAGTREGCGQPNRLLIRSASSARFPQLLSVISIPDSLGKVDQAVAALWESHLSAVQSADELKVFLHLPVVKSQLDGISSEQVMAAIVRRRSGQPADGHPVKEAEFDALVEAKAEPGSGAADGDFCASTLSSEAWQAPWTQPLEQVVLVHRATGSSCPSGLPPLSGRRT